MERSNRIRWFEDLSTALAHRNHSTFGLLTQISLAPEELQPIQQAMYRCISACLGFSMPLTEAEILECLNKTVAALANRTPNGILLPKQEFGLEFNALNQTVATWFKALQVDHLFYQINCPLICRIVTGQADGNLSQRPYATSKIHLDAWNGDPADNINLFLPIAGDIEHTTVDFFQPPDEFNLDYLQIFTDYTEGMRFLPNPTPYPTRLQLGTVHLMDAAVPHRTVKQGGGVRISLELRMRRVTSAPDRAAIEASCNRDRLQHYLPLADWYELGASKQMAFKDSFAAAQQGIFSSRPADERTYEIVAKV